MTMDIPNDYQDILRQAVANGAYANPEDALRRALELFAAEQANAQTDSGFLEAEQLKRKTWDERNSTAIQQSKQGMSKPLDGEAVIDRLNARLADHETRH